MRLYGISGIEARYADFLRAYIRHYRETGVFNAAAAARAVGYAVASAKVEGARILAIPEVHAAWRAYMEACGKAAEIPITDQEIEHDREVYALAHFRLTDVIEYDGDAVRILPTEEWPWQARRAVKMIEQKEVTKVLPDGTTETTRSTRIEAHAKEPVLRLEAQKLGKIKGGTTVRLPGGQEIDSDGAITVYQVNQVNHFEIPDNGRGPKAIGAPPG